MVRVMFFCNRVYDVRGPYANVGTSGLTSRFFFINVWLLGKVGIRVVKSCRASANVQVSLTWSFRVLSMLFRVVNLYDQWPDVRRRVCFTANRYYVSEDQVNVLWGSVVALLFGGRFHRVNRNSTIIPICMSGTCYLVVFFPTTENGRRRRERGV